MPQPARRKDDVIQIRASAEAKAILNRAAAIRGQKLSEFMLECARRQAEDTIFEQRTFSSTIMRTCAFLRCSTTAEPVGQDPRPVQAQAAVEGMSAAAAHFGRPSRLLPGTTYRAFSTAFILHSTSGNANGRVQARGFLWRRWTLNFGRQRWRLGSRSLDCRRYSGRRPGEDLMTTKKARSTADFCSAYSTPSVRRKAAARRFRLGEADARLITIGELGTGCLEGTLQGLNCSPRSNPATSIDTLAAPSAANLICRRKILERVNDDYVHRCEMALIAREDC